MRLALCSTVVPFVYGGYRNIVEWLESMLVEAGHDVERVYLPQIDGRDILFPQMMAFRWIDLSAADRIICMRPQAHLIPHPHKILWFIHHIRAYYDLWNTEYGAPDDVPHRGFRDALRAVDDAGLAEARKIFTNSRVVSDRLRRYNGIDSEVLYPPVFQAERFHRRGHNDEIVYICRVEHHKRQHLLVEAMKHTRTAVRLRLCGETLNGGYRDELRRTIKNANLGDRVTYDSRWISEGEKVDILADCLAAAYLPLAEDSYGYPSVEASHASKAVLTTTDSGGVIELVEDRYNGFVVPPAPEAIAEAMDRLYLDREQTGRMGDNAKARLGELKIDWSHVLDRLLS